MPLYEYRCDGCDRRFEILQRMGQGADGLQCPHCGGSRLDKQLSSFAAGTGSSSGVSTGFAGGCAGGSGFT